VRRIHAGELTGFAAALFEAGGVAADEARLVAESLVGANLRGHDSHGVMRVPFYLKQVASGECKPGAQLSVINETPTLLAADGNWGFGQTQAQRLSRRLIEKAKSSGIGLGTLVHSCHIGRLGEYCELAADAGLCSIVMVNTHGAARRVAPPGGKVPRLGTNPIALGAPNGTTPLVLDFGTSATAEGKVRVKRIAGELCPDGWLLDCEGRPTNDPHSLYADPPGSIRPMGGDQAYKGFGLALMIELFAGALAGGLCIREKAPNQLGNCVFMMFVNPAMLGGAEHFAKEATDLDAFVRGCPRIEGCNEILLPGDPERRVMAERLASGIPIDDGNWAELAKEAARLSVGLEVRG
jgi:uncharacterized oxidoreductase